MAEMETRLNDQREAHKGQRERMGAELDTARAELAKYQKQLATALSKSELLGTERDEAAAQIARITKERDVALAYRAERTKADYASAAQAFAKLPEYARELLGGDSFLKANESTPEVIVDRVTVATKLGPVGTSAYAGDPSKSVGGATFEGHSVAELQAVIDDARSGSKDELTRFANRRGMTFPQAQQLAAKFEMSLSTKKK